MMHDVNWWLMALSFLAGLLLTFLFMIRRVSREVPIYAALGRGPKVDAAPKVDVKKPVVETKAPLVETKAPVVETETPVVETETPVVETKPPVVEVAAATAAGAAAASLATEKPYGAGSVRVTKTVTSPRTGYLVKGDEDTMRYFTVESPDYEEVGAEVWFQDAASAERAGFLRWDAPGESTVTAAVQGATPHGEHTGETVETAKFTSVAGEPDEGPYGAGSARAGADGVGPAGWTIKGNADSMLYHTPASPSYEATIAEIWFADEATAEAAGFKKYM